MSTRDLFLSCALTCVSVCVEACICLSVGPSRSACVRTCACLHVNVLTAHKSVSSLRHHDPEHALLPVSLRLASSPERGEDSSNDAPSHPPFFSLRNGLIYTRQFSATATALSAAIFPCICRQIQASVCKDAHKTSSEWINFRVHLHPH